MPKSHTLTIGDRIETIAVDVLEALIEATAHSANNEAEDRRNAATA